MYYTIYKVTNLTNGKIYIGKHQTTNINDRYFGSGKAIKSAIKKHGKINFVKEVLFVYESEQQMNDKERELITNEFISSDQNYNSGVGGEGGPHFKGKFHTDEWKSKMSKERIGMEVSVERRKAISESNSKRVANRTHNFCSPGLKRKTYSPFSGRSHTPESIAKMLLNRKLNKEKKLAMKAGA